MKADTKKQAEYLLAIGEVFAAILTLHEAVPADVRVHADGLLELEAFLSDGSSICIELTHAPNGHTK